MVEVTVPDDENDKTAYVSLGSSCIGQTRDVEEIGKPEGGPMAYYKVRIEVWCDWNPAECDVEEIGESINAGEAICTKREIVAFVDRPKDIDDDEAMVFFGGEECDADESQG